MAAVPNIPTPPTAGIPLEAASIATGGAPLAYNKPDLKTLSAAKSPAKLAETAKAVEKKPVQPATEAAVRIPLEQLNDPEMVNKALEDSAKVMLKIRSAMLGKVALARQCGGTDIGREFQYAVLGEIRNMGGEGLTKHQFQILEAQKTKLGELAFPDKPRTDALSTFITKNIPATLNSGRMALELKGNWRSVPDVVYDLMGNEKFKPIQKKFTSELMGDHAGMSFKDQLKGVNISEFWNKKALAETFNPNSQMNQSMLKDKSFWFMVSLMMATTGIQMLQENDSQRQRQGAHAG
jgi:hypothetical protein